MYFMKSVYSQILYVMALLLTYTISFFTYLYIVSATGRAFVPAHKPLGAVAGQSAYI